MIGDGGTQPVGGLDGGLGLAQPATLEGWGQIFTRVEVWEPLIRVILARHGIDARDQLKGVVPGSHAVFALGRRLIIKVYSPLFPDDRGKELELYPFLGAVRALKVPRLVASGTVEPSVPEAGGRCWPYAIIEFRKGEPLAGIWRELTASQRCGIATVLAQLVSRLHAMPLRGLSSIETTQDSWLGFLERQAASAQARHRAWGSMREGLLAQIPSYLSGAWRPPAQGWRICLLHCDVTADHVLVDPRPGAGKFGGDLRITGLIDLGDAMAGDCEFEFLAVYLSALAGDREAFRVFLRAYGHPGWEDRLFSRRMLAYCLLHEFDLFAEIARLWPGLLGRSRSLEELAEAAWGPPADWRPGEQ
jgi:Ser/Thr protein kinase RdoA (MazF antagonist)